jgi:trehalose 6-phosphate phosphatase
VGGVTHINPAAVIASGSVAESMAAVKMAADRFGMTDGIIYENKGVTGSIHYRLAKDQEHAHAVLLPLIQVAADARGLKVTEGRMVIELRPMLAINKGTALRSVVEREGLISLVFLGDDVTDLDAFHALERLREEGQISGLNIAVVAPESSPEIAKAADAVVHGVECCVQLLTAIADAFDTGEKVTNG